jgi:hypothetical protein
MVTRKNKSWKCDTEMHTEHAQANPIQAKVIPCSWLYYMQR